MHSSLLTVDLQAAFTDHDRLFKELLTVFFVDFVDLFLPDIAAELDRESLAFLNNEIFTDVTSGEQHIVDILVQARLRGNDTCFVIHVENQAKAQPGFARRMFRYFAALDAKLDVPIYPVALFTFDRPLREEPDHYRVAFGAWEPLRFQFRAIQLNRLNWRDFVNRPNPVAAALMAKMKIAPKDRPRVKLECLRLLATFKLDRARMQLLSGFIDSYLKLTAAENRQFEREIAALPQEEREAAMPLTISWKEEGRTEGRTEGRRELILVQATRRFGPPSARALAALEAIKSPERLMQLGERLLDVSDWDAFLAVEQWT